MWSVIKPCEEFRNTCNNTPIHMMTSSVLHIFYLTGNISRFRKRSVSESGTGPLDSEAPGPPLRNDTGSGSMYNKHSIAMVVT